MITALAGATDGPVVSYGGGAVAVVGGARFLAIVRLLNECETIEERSIILDNVGAALDRLDPGTPAPAVDGRRVAGRGALGLVWVGDRVCVHRTSDGGSPVENVGYAADPPDFGETFPDERTVSEYIRVACDGDPWATTHRGCLVRPMEVVNDQWVPMGS